MTGRRFFGRRAGRRSPGASGYLALPVTNGLLEHWRADAGVTGTSDVTAWDGQYAGIQMVKPDTFFGTTALTGSGTTLRLAGGYSGGPNLATNDSATGDVDWQAGATIICVGGWASSPSGTRLWKTSEDTLPAGGGGSNGLGYYYVAAGNRARLEDDSSVLVFEQAVTTPSDVKGGRYIYAIRVQDDQQQYWVNGLETDSDTDSNDAATITTGQIGVLQSSTAFLQEVAVYTRYLTDAEVTSVTLAMANRWGLAVPTLPAGVTAFFEDAAADTTVTSSPDVDTWSDQSGNGYDLDGGGTASFKPHLLSTGFGFNDLYDAVDFDGSQQRFGCPAELDALIAQNAEDRTFSIVALIEVDTLHTGVLWGWTTSSSSERSLFYVRSSGGTQRIAYSVENSTSADVYESTDVLTSGQAVVVAMTLDATDLRLYIDGVLDSGGAQVVTDRDWGSASNRSVVGANVAGASTTNSFFNGKIAALGYWPSELTQDQVRQVGAYMADYAALPRRLTW